MQIKEIAASETWGLRHQVMWPAMPLDYVKLPEDSQGKHYGLFIEEEIVSVVSLFIEGEQAQFRKLATVAHMQGRGYGSALLAHLLIQAALVGVTKIWCNARASKAGFYRNFGFQESAHQFEKDGQIYVVMEKRFINESEKISHNQK